MIIVRDVNTPSSVIGRPSRQKIHQDEDQEEQNSVTSCTCQTGVRHHTKL